MNNKECQIVALQQHEPVYLTSGCCEPAHGSPDVFKTLGLPFTPRQEGGYEYENWGSAYPLTPDEEKFIGEDYAEGVYGGAAMAYSVLYKNKKWLAPSIEVCFHEKKVFSRGSYGGTAVETSADAIDAANKLATALRPKVEKVGGLVLVMEEGSGNDRHDVLLLFPFEYAKRFGNFNGWKKHVSSLIQLPPPVATVE